MGKRTIAVAVVFALGAGFSLGSPAQALRLGVQVVEPGDARVAFDAPRARRHGRLTEDLDHADLAGVVHVGAAADRKSVV